MTNSQPTTAAAWHEAGAKALKEKKGEEALKAFQKALAVDPEHVPSLLSLAKLLFHPQHPSQGMQLAARAKALAPNDAETYRVLAGFFYQLNDVPLAEATLREAIRLDDSDAWSFGLLTEMLMKLGRVSEAVDSMREGVKRDPDNVAMCGSLLFTSNYLDFENPRELFDVICEFDRHAKKVEPAHVSFSNDRDPGRKLRVGYVSPDFRWHAVAHFARPVLSAHDREQVEIWCYAEYDQADLNTLRFKDIADHWVPTKDVSDEDLAKQIREDKIDVLVDLAGHSAHNRLLVFGRRPAPVQVTWLGYCNSAGVRALEYRITDPLCDPPGLADEIHVEKLIRLPHGFHCFCPPEEDPPIRPAPCLRNGCVTFGSFNNYRKHTPDVIALWAEVLKAVPDSRLLLKSADYAHASIRHFFLSAFQSHGVEPERVRLVSTKASTFGHLELYGQIDICLDSFPYNGTTTTCDAMWMGVPVITLEGDVHRARVSASLLTQVGHSEWIAKTGDDYVRIAQELASDPAPLDAMRPKLREDMRESPLCDGPGLAVELEKSYREMWQAWVAR